MKLEVPFYIQGINECGPAALQMALEFLGEKHEKEEIKKLIESESTGATWTIGLAKASAQLGFKTEFYSKSLGFNPENFDLEYYQRETDGAENVEIKIKKLQAECIKYKVEMEEREIPLDEIISKINENCTAIVLIDWGKIKNVDRYIGHFLPIVGFDEENIYLHQPGPKDPEANFKINKFLFDTARKSKGTDEDIIFIHRKMH
ncbi:peptidase C39 family protein [Candidatus Woesearchaeota archaeon]|nr:peptidase C39 family protein [Candidatus Woesearchaeota archaeon]